MSNFRGAFQKILSLENKNKSDFILYSSRLFVSLQAEIKNLIFNNKSTMKKILSKLCGGVLLCALSMSLTSCEDILGHWEKPTPTPIMPTVDDVIKYGFKVTDLAGVDRTEAVTSLKMSTDDGPIAEAEVSGGKITIKAEKLSGITSAIDFWFEAEIGGKPYIAKVNINPTTLSPETDKTLEMATLGDVILADGKFGVAGTSGEVAKICYLGSETAEAAYGFNHGLALAMSDANSGSTCMWRTSNGDAGHTKQTSSTFTEESGLQYNSFTPDHDTSNYPAFQAAIANNSTAAPTGCSAWFLASGYQWQKMAGAVGGYNNLGLQDDALYWSSSEVSASRACYFYSNDSDWDDVSKVFEYRVRACLAF